jgi:hypothetical protein
MRKLAFLLFVIALVVAACSSDDDALTTTAAAGGDSTTTREPTAVPVSSFSLGSESFDGTDCRPLQAGSVFDDVLVVQYCVGEMIHALRAVDLGSSGQTLWRVEPSTVNEVMTSVGVGQRIVATTWRIETPASGLSDVTKAYELRIYDKDRGSLIQSLALDDVLFENWQPTVRAVSLGDKVFVTWRIENTVNMSAAYSTDGELLWSASGIRINDSNQHFASFAETFHYSQQQVMHLDTFRQVSVDPSDPDSTALFTSCSPYVQYVDDAHDRISVDIATGVGTIVSNLSVPAPLGSYAAPILDQGVLAYRDHASGEPVWQVDASNDAFDRWRVESGVIIVEASAGVFAIDPRSGVASPYGGPIATNGSGVVSPRWYSYVNRDNDDEFTIVQHGVPSDCELWQAEIQVSEDLPIVGSP